MPCICAETGAGNSPLFWHLLSSACRSLRLSLQHSPQNASKLEVGKKLGEDTARAADPNRPKGYSMPQDVMPSNKS